MPQQNQTPDANKQVVQKFVEECWNQGNLNKASELLADQVRFHDPVFPNLNAGIQNIKTHIEGCRRAFPDLTLPSTGSKVRRSPNRTQTGTSQR